MATTTSKLGLTMPSYTDAADVGVLNNNFDILDREVAKRTRVLNLLDNSNFRNPVNQRGQTTVTQNFQYLIDRWAANNVDTTRPISITASGLNVDGSSGNATTSAYQNVSNLRDGAYTAAAKAGNSVWIVQFTLTNGVYAKTNGYNDGKGQIYISGNGETLSISLQVFAGYSVTFEWAALYEGTYTADTLPAYQPKGYATELAECQRYCLRIRYGVISGISLGTNAQLIIPTPVTMRMEAPTFFTTDAIWVYGADGTTALFTPTSTVNTGYGIRLDGTLSANLGNKPCVVPDFGGYLLADL